MNKNSANNIIDMLEKWFAKAPSLPSNVRETIVKITPIIAIIFGVLGILGSLSGLGLLAFFSPLALFGGSRGMASYGTGFIAALFWLVSAVLLLASYPGTKSRKISGWNLLFWGQLVNLVGSVISLSFVSGLIGAVIGLYLLFQIKSYYK